MIDVCAVCFEPRTIYTMNKATYYQYHQCTVLLLLLLLSLWREPEEERLSSMMRLSINAAVGKREKALPIHGIRTTISECPYAPFEHRQFEPGFWEEIVDAMPMTCRYLVSCAARRNQSRPRSRWME